MRLAFVLTGLHQRAAFEAGPVDSEWLLALAAVHDIEVFVDQATLGSETLRQAGVPVTPSLKRIVGETDGSLICADAVLARAVRVAHERSPFDAVVYGSDATADLAWFEPRLRQIARGVALGAGLAHDLARVWEDRALFALLARRMWSWTGLAASADFLLSDVPPEAFGLRGETLPPWFRTAEPQAAAEPPVSGPWVAVAATAVGPRAARGLVSRVVAKVPPSSATTYLLLVRRAPGEGAPVEKELLEGCPSELRRRVVVIPADADGVAADYLGQADLLVAASRAELAVPAIADFARRRGAVVLDSPAATSTAAGVFPDAATAASHRSDAEVRMQVLTWTEPVSGFRGVLEGLAAELGEQDLVVIHAPGAARPALRLFQSAGLRGVDVVVWGKPEGTFGSADPGALYPHALAVRAAALPDLARAVESCRSLWDLVCWCASLEWIDRLRLLVIPAPFDVECHGPGEVGEISASWRLESGVLPAPRWLPSAHLEATPPRPEPVVLPRHRYLPHSSTGVTDALRAWARRTPWRDRIRLALPSRWGLLDRAMRGRW